MITEFIKENNLKIKKESNIILTAYFVISVMVFMSIAKSSNTIVVDFFSYFLIALFLGLGIFMISTEGIIPEISLDLGDKILYKNGFVFKESSVNSFLIEEFDSDTRVVLLKDLASDKYQEISVSKLVKEYIKA